MDACLFKELFYQVLILLLALNLALKENGFMRKLWFFLSGVWTVACILTVVELFM